MPFFLLGALFVGFAIAVSRSNSSGGQKLLAAPRHDPSVAIVPSPHTYAPNPPHYPHPGQRAAPAQARQPRPFGRQCAVASRAQQSPIFVLDEMIRAGHTPPPMVIQCAIAEAEMLGQYELASDIMSRFIVPVVREHMQAQEQQAPQREREPEHEREPRRQARPSGPSDPSQQAQPYDESEYELDEFARPQPRVKAPTGAPVNSGADVSAPARGVSDAEMQQAYAAMGLDNSGMPGSGANVNKKQKQGQAGSPQGAQGNDGSNVVVGGALGAMNWGTSPIAGVNPANWGGFVGRVSREAPTYSSARHVGQFRQRRERLEDLGFEPEEVARSSSKQLTALEADMRDAYHHAQEGGLLDYVGKAIATPPVGGEPAGKHAVTLSGLLGVIQAAGIEGACDWLERPGDRAVFPHTTRAFLRTNNVF